MAIYYIDVDDEITSAAARIRDSSDTRIALVIQGGSRVATSRINFRLLAREARHHGRRLAIIATDPSARSLAQAAGLPLYATVAEYQKAEPPQPVGGGAAGIGSTWDALDELAETVDKGASGRAARLAGAGGSTRGGGTPQPRVRTGRRFGVSRWLAAAVVAAFVVGGFGAFLLLPNATVVLTLKEEPLGPLNLTVNVDPAVMASNDSTLTVPGVSKEFTGQAAGTFDATGQNVVETVATGTVTFTSGNTGVAVTIPTGTQVETAAKVAFTTTSAVTVPKAVVVPPSTITLATADVGVTAVKKGLSGNVAAGAIVNVPPWLATALVVADQVTNRKATGGGTHTVTPFVRQSDIDAAEASLAGQIDSSVRAKMTEPEAVSAGLELFPKTAHMGDPTYEPDPATLLNQERASFDLAATGTATATAANLTTVRSLAERKIRARVGDGHALVEGSVVVTLGSPATVGAAISVPVVATGLQAATVDVDQLRAAIKGKTVEEAKSYLSKYGDAEVSISPFWVSTISGFDFRIDVRVIAPTARPVPTAKVVATPRLTLAPGRTPVGTRTPSLTESATPGPSASPDLSPSATPEATASSEASPTATP